MNPTEVKAAAERLISQLEGWRDAKNLAPLAKLRRVFNDATRHEAWEVLGRFGPQAIANPVYETVAGCFALYPDAAPDIGNLGATLRRIQQLSEGSKWDSLDDRFRRLIACRTREELSEPVRHAVRHAKSKEAPVNYRQLFLDLWWWNDRTRAEWAKSYWQVPPPPFGDLEERGEFAPEEPVPSEG
jgi:CRISPR type I-E-associated protein CasB/Cse2